MNKFIALTALTFSLSTFQPALAESHEGNKGFGREIGDSHHGHDDDGFGSDHKKFKDMSPEDRKKFHEERKAKWEGMSKEDKLKLIETRRSERQKKMDEKWSSMSDDEKLGFVEKRMEKKHDRRENRRDGKDDSGNNEHENQGKHRGHENKGGKDTK